MPNMVAPDVPYGEDDSQNVEIKRWGTPREFPFTPLDHVDIGENLGIVDIARSTKITVSYTHLDVYKRQQEHHHLSEMF